MAGEEKKGTLESRLLFHGLEGFVADARWGLTATPDLADARSVSLLARFHRAFVPWDSDVEAQHYLKRELVRTIESKSIKDVRREASSEHT